MKNLSEIVFEIWGLNLKIEPYGDNEQRNNIFVGRKGEENYIVKIEDLKNLNQVNLSIKVANEILKSDEILSSRYLKNLNEEYTFVSEDKVMTVQIKEEVKDIKFYKKEDLKQIGLALGEFHKRLLKFKTEDLRNSDFYKDFMFGEVPKAQSKERLKEIEKFYQNNSPNYELLSMGIIHNDLNVNNILKVSEKYFFIDFEHLKRGPLVSDIGVLILEIWDFKNGLKDYNNKLKYILEGYREKIKLSKYDEDNIIVFSLRYLYSDENWFTYWSQNGNPKVIDLLPKIKEKQEILLTCKKNK